MHLALQSYGFPGVSGPDTYGIPGWKSSIRNQLVLTREEQKQEEGGVPFDVKKSNKVHKEAVCEENVSSREACSRYFVALLKACAYQKDLEKGRRLHAEVVGQGFLESDIFIGSSLVNLYAKCGQLQEAQKLLHKLPVRNVVCWNALVAGYAQHGHGKEALNCFKQMQLEGITPNAVTFVCTLKACGSLGARDKGQQIHATIAREGWIERNIYVGNALVDMYAKCGLLETAQEVFENLPFRDAVSWSTLIAGYADSGCGEEALICFEQMQREGILPSAVTLTSTLKACGMIGAIDKGQILHAEIAGSGMLEKDLVLGTALVDMYTKCGLLTKAQEVFDKIPVRDIVLWNTLLAAYAKSGSLAEAQIFFNKLPVRDVVSWSALIAGYAQRGYGETALCCLEQMKLEGVAPDAVTYVSSLKACGTIGAANTGLSLHAEIAQKGLLEKDNVLGSALVDMYTKCGLLESAREVFDRFPCRDTLSWNVLIGGYAQLGQVESVFDALNIMKREGIKPDEATFISVLNACSHTGSVSKGQMCFESMTNDYDIIPNLEHKTCIIDLLGRAGQIDEAVAMIKNMCCYADLVVWHVLLAACRKWSNLEIGRQAFEHALQLNEMDSTAYFCISNIFLDAGMLEDANKVRL